MSEWAPVLKAFVWPLFLAIVLISTRSSLVGIVAALKARIEVGAEFEAGSAGTRSRGGTQTSGGPPPAGPVPGPRRPPILIRIYQESVGEFNVAATARFKDGHAVKLERYQTW
jgi:hypothetical protein